MTMSTLYPVSKLLKDMVEEKETRMKEVRQAARQGRTAS